MSTLRTDPANPIFNSTQTPLSLTVGCYNLAGAITLERFQQAVTAITDLPQPPSIIALSESKPTGEPADTFGAIARLASAGHYHHFKCHFFAVCICTGLLSLSLPQFFLLDDLHHFDAAC